jgi:hypothetical protein
MSPIGRNPPPPASIAKPAAEVAQSSSSAARQSGDTTQKQETLGALSHFHARTANTSAGRPRLGTIPGQAPAGSAGPKTVPVHVREENPETGDGIIVTLRTGHWVEKPKKAKSSQQKIQVGLHTGKDTDQYVNDIHEQAGILPSSVDFEGHTILHTDSAPKHAAVLASYLCTQQKEKPHPNTDPRTPEGAAWLRGEWTKVCDRVTDRHRSRARK